MCKDHLKFDKDEKDHSKHLFWWGRKEGRYKSIMESVSDI